MSLQSVDPRIGQELEKLNNSCEKINNLEVTLDELKRNYQDVQETSQEDIRIISSKIKNAIEYARPFYEARKQSNELLKELKNEQANYEKAKTNLAAAKEMVYLAEQSVTQNAQGTGGLDIALQEMISHATSRVNQYTDECNKVQNHMRITELKHEMSNMHVSRLQSQLKNYIKVSRPYYETRANANAKLRSLKLKIIELETDVQRTKAAYNEALQNLEKISDEIHKLREDQKLNAFLDEDFPQSQHPPAQSSNTKTYLCYQNSLSDDYELVDDDDDDDDIDGNGSTPNEQQPQHTDVWSDIPLNSGTMTASNSTTSSYSQNSDREETLKNEDINMKETSKDDDKKSGGFSEWISNSSFRRQSLEDVFAQSTLFGKFGRSLERRNSESEVESTSAAASASTAKKEFFLFGRTEGLTDSQVESLFLPDEHL